MLLNPKNKEWTSTVKKKLSLVSPYISTPYVFTIPKMMATQNILHKCYMTKWKTNIDAAIISFSPTGIPFISLRLKCPIVYYYWVSIISMELPPFFPSHPHPHWAAPHLSLENLFMSHITKWLIVGVSCYTWNSGEQRVLLLKFLLWYFVCFFECLLSFWRQVLVFQPEL